MGTQRALFLGGFDLPGNNLLDSIRLQRGGTPVIIAINMNNASNVMINNSQIGDPNFAGASEYARGVSMSNNSGLTLNNSSVSVHGSNVIGIDAVNSNLTLNNSNVSAKSSGVVTGINAAGTSKVTLNHSQVTANSSSTTTGIAVDDSAHVTLNNSHVLANGTVFSRGIFIINSNAKVDLKNGSTVSANSAGTARAIDNLVGGTVTNDGTAKCFENGATVTCS